MSGEAGSNCPSDCLDLEESRSEEENCSSGPGPAMSSLQDATETSSHQNRMEGRRRMAVALGEGQMQCVQG